MSNIQYLEQIDEMWYRKMFSLAKSAPKEGMYIESGKMPIRFIIMTRRLPCFHNILHKNEDELLNRFLFAQQVWTGKKDWICQVRKNMTEIGSNLTDQEIEKMSYEEFKNKVKLKVRLFAIKYLKKLQHSHSKTKELVLEDFSPASYLMSPFLNKEEVQLLYKLRNYMIDVKQNFGSYHKENMWCKTCYLFQDTQKHLLQCPPIIEKLKNLIDFNSVNHGMIFDSNENQVKIVKVFSMILNTRQNIIDELRNPP